MNFHAVCPGPTLLLTMNVSKANLALSVEVVIAMDVQKEDGWFRIYDLVVFTSVYQNCMHEL